MHKLKDKIAVVTGGMFKARQLDRDYGFTDIDGSQPMPFCMPARFGE
ncbi:MAG: hypothetical protein ACE5HS_03105 [bacterium]